MKKKIIPNNRSKARDGQHIQNIKAQESNGLRIVEAAVKTSAELKDVVDKQSEGSLPERLQAVDAPGGNESRFEKILIFMSYLMFILLFPMSLCFMFMEFNAIACCYNNSQCDRNPEVVYAFGQQIFNQQYDVPGYEVHCSKDISMPIPLQKAMTAEAESTRLANAKVIVAQAEIESTKSLKAATEILMDNPCCMQLRYLQYLHMIAGEKTHTYLVPFSVKAIKKLME